MTSIRFSVHVDASLPSSVQASIARAMRQHMAQSAGGRGAPAGALLVAAQAVQELLQAAGVATGTKVWQVRAKVPPEVELPEGASRRNCTICLESMEPGQRCCRPPCLHAFHGDCLRQWLRQSPTCPICKLSLAEPVEGGLPPPPSMGRPRELRFRLAELAGLSARELCYIAGFLGIEVQRGAERPDLELLVLGSPKVRILASREELQALAVDRLQALLRSVGGKEFVDVMEKEELVGSLFGSGRFVQEQDSSRSDGQADVPTTSQEAPGAADVAAADASSGGASGSTQEGTGTAADAGSARAEDARGSEQESGAAAADEAEHLGSGNPGPQDGQVGPARRGGGAPSRRSAPY
mmetsp:Transcript_110001/g.328859  ORF Transcript_110001/g.328859 Transcript_110001/m.328859 type:complete len:353 (-) Transcript_110001:47-1105(-)